MKVMNLKQQLFEIIQPDDGSSVASRVFDKGITLLILLSVVVVFAVTFDLSIPVRRTLGLLEVVASVVFTVEYLARIWTADLLYPKCGSIVSRIRYVVSPMALIDLLAVLPFWLPMLMPGELLGMRAIRLVRLLRIVKLNRYFDAMSSIAAVLREKKRELLGSLFFVFLLMLISSLLIYSVEHDAQPQAFRNAFSGFWWAVATLTTVGYGDIYPITTIGRILGGLIALLGVAAVAIPTGIISSGLMERMGSEKDTVEDEPYSYCPRCGAKLR